MEVIFDSEGNTMVDGIRSPSSSYAGASLANAGTELSPQEKSIAGFKAHINKISQQLSNVSISVSPAFLEKMANDPETAAKGKEMLDGIPAAQSWLENAVRASGSKLVSSGVIIDADGNMSGWSVSETSSGPDTNSLLDGAQDKTRSKKVTGDKADDVWQATRNLFDLMNKDLTAGASNSLASRGIDILA